MDERTIGLILRTRPLTESSLIVQWLTRDFGRISTVARGARRAKSPFLGKLDLFYLADLSYQPSRRSELHILKEVQVRQFHLALRSDLGYLEQASYFAQLLELTTETGTPLPRLFELLLTALAVLPAVRPRPVTVFAFEMQLLTELGLDPEHESAGVTAGAREILRIIREADWGTILRLALSQEQTREIEIFLGRFLIFHVGRFPKGRESACRAGAPYERGGGSDRGQGF